MPYGSPSEKYRTAATVPTKSGVVRRSKRLHCGVGVVVPKDLITERLASQTDYRPPTPTSDLRLPSHRHRKPHLPDRGVVVRIPAEFIAGTIPLNDVLHLPTDGQQAVVGHEAGQTDLSDTACRDVDTLIAPHVAKDRCVVDQEIEVETIESQRNGIRIVDSH